MKHQNLQNTQQIQRLLFDTHFDVLTFRQKLHVYDKTFTSKPKQSIIFSLIETLIIQEKFYDYFTPSFTKSLAFQNKQITQKNILNYGYAIVEQLFASKYLYQNDQFTLNTILKKCNLDIFLLIAITKGYLRNSAIKKDKIRTFFVQSFKKNNNHFTGIQRFTKFHQSLLQKSLTANSFIYNVNKAQKYRLQLTYFIEFYTQNKDFFPSTLQCDNLLFKMMLSIKLQVEQDIKIYQKFQRQYFQQNQFHLVSTYKNIRFLIEFFRNPFNQKVIEFYPQKVFLKILAKYKQQEIDKILSYSEVGLTWNQQQISSCIGNIFKLGLTSVTYNFFKSLLDLWLRNGLNDLILKVSETYIPKVFIFMKHEKLFDVSFNFLQQFTLGPKNPTINILNKLLEKMFTFYQKDCPIQKKQIFEEFMYLIETKYEKIATLEDKSYIQLKNLLKNIRENQKRLLLKEEEVKQKLKKFQWQEVKVPLFSKSGSESLGKLSVQNQAGEYRGLYNIGNSCYMNSFLQCLYMTIEFRYNILSLSTLALQQNLLQKMHQTQSNINAIKDQKSEKNIPQRNKSLMARQLIRPTAQLQRLFAQLMKSKRTSISPITIKNVSSPEFKNSYQQDTIEFGRSFLDIISRSSVQNMFEGQQTNQIICPNCHQSRYKKENFIDIMLTDYDDQQQTKESDSQAKSQNEGLKIGKMLRKFFEPQKMQGLTCDYCSTKSLQSLKKHYLSKLPNYLILTMKRFCYDIKENKNIKKHYRIDLDEGLIRVQGQMYELYGIIVHRGQSANSGHYFAFCKEWKLKQEIKIDKISEEKPGNMNQVKNQSIETNEHEAKFQTQKMQIQNQHQFQTEKSPQSKLNQLDQQQIINKNNTNRWLCLNDCNVSVFESFHNVKQFLDLNQQDTPYVLFYQKLSHLHSPQCQHLKQPIKLRQPLEKFLEKDNNDYLKFVENKMRGNQNSKQVDWKNFGKVKGFTAYDFFKFTKQDDDQNGNGFGGNGFGNNPIL